MNRHTYVEEYFYSSEQLAHFNSRLTEEKTSIEETYGGLQLNTLLLNATQRIRFKMVGDVWWRRSDAMVSTFLGFAVWDRSDGMSLGLFLFVSVCFFVEALKVV